ncbi:hypothetical protein Lal_00016029 [Lupinus albus]|nr:hypothetical protein Lal_00016029 [Lupinus albus]
MPSKEQWLIKVVENIDNNIVVACGVDFRTRELTIDENTLLVNTQWRNVAISDIPCEIESWISVDDMYVKVICKRV